MPNISKLKIKDAGGAGDCLFRSIAAFYTEDKKTIGELHFPLRQQMFDCLEEKPWRFPRINDSAEIIKKMRKPGKSAYQDYSSIAADLLQRNIIVIHHNAPNGLELYSPQDQGSGIQHPAFSKHPIIIYSTPGHFQSVSSGKSDVSTDKILQEISLVASKNIIDSGLLESGQPAPFETAEELAADRKRVIKLLAGHDIKPEAKTNTNIFKMIFNLIKKIFSFFIAIFYKFKSNKFPYDLNLLLEKGVIFPCFINTKSNNDPEPTADESGPDQHSVISTETRLARIKTPTKDYDSDSCSVSTFGDDVTEQHRDFRRPSGC